MTYIRKGPDEDYEPERDNSGRFKKGHTGNPGGYTKDGVYGRDVVRGIRKKLLGSMNEIVEKAIDMAHEGDPAMIKLLLDRAFPKVNGNELPHLYELESFGEKIQALWRSMCAGEISIDEYQSITTALAASAKTEVNTDIKKKIEEYENVVDLQSKGN